MNIYRISKCKFINDLTGYGAFVNGGRWNSEGIFMLYTASSASLALLETLVHLPSYLAANDFCILKMEIPDKLIQTLNVSELPKNWKHYPNNYSTQKIGNQFINEQKYLALKIPSAVLEMEFNILINPSHPSFSKLKIVSHEKLQIDQRLTQ